jgi:hypothetical protein
MRDSCMKERHLRLILEGKSKTSLRDPSMKEKGTLQENNTVCICSHCSEVGMRDQRNWNTSKTEKIPHNNG